MIVFQFYYDFGLLWFVYQFPLPPGAALGTGAIGTTTSTSTSSSQVRPALSLVAKRAHIGMSVDSIEKRALSQTESSVREGVLRGGIRARLANSPFSIPLRIPVSSTEQLPIVGSFPTNTSTQLFLVVLWHLPDWHLLFTTACSHHKYQNQRDRRTMDELFLVCKHWCVSYSLSIKSK